MIPWQYLSCSESLPFLFLAVCGAWSDNESLVGWKETVDIDNGNWRVNVPKAGNDNSEWISPKSRQLIQTSKTNKQPKAGG